MCGVRKIEEINTQKELPAAEPDRQFYFMEKCRKWAKGFEAENGRVPTACVVNMGCQMNARDSEKLVGILEESGYRIKESEDADFVIFNTCTVRENANNKVYGRLGVLHGYKKKNPDMVIALCGCMMQEPAVVDKITRSYPFVNLIFGTHNIYKFAELLYTAVSKRGTVVDIWESSDNIVEDLPSERKYPFKSGVNIMFGCNNFCSYCIVPYVRGRERSRRMEDILDEVKRLTDQGVIEVMLLGQNVNSYGKTLHDPITFAKLLQQVEQIEKIRRIRFMTSHPKDLSDELIEVMKNSKKICRHLHLPVQSGSTRILQQMNRKYTKEDYLHLVERIRNAIPDISLTTDIIVGFPGETEQDFEETLDIVRRVCYDSAYTFLYSKRSGTPAAQLKEQIEPQIAKERFQRLLEVIQETSSKRLKELTGTVQQVLVEEQDNQQAGYLTGRLDNNLLVHFPGEKSLIGQLHNVKLTECKGFYYFGELNY